MTLAPLHGLHVAQSCLSGLLKKQFQRRIFSVFQTASYNIIGSTRQYMQGWAVPMHLVLSFCVDFSALQNGPRSELPTHL